MVPSPSVEARDLFTSYGVIENVTEERLDLSAGLLDRI